MAIQQILGGLNFEIIRDAIGAILTLELSNQKTLIDSLPTPTPEQIETSKILAGTTVWKERMTPFQDEEQFIVVPLLFNVDFNNQSNFQTDTKIQFYIDVYGKAKADKTADTRADYNSAVRLNRILGLIYSIIHHSDYRILGFSNKPEQVIRSRNLTNFKRTEVDENLTSVGISMYRAILEVESIERNEESVPDLGITEIFTKVLINETQKGYQFLTNI